MKRTELRRKTPLQSGCEPMRRTPLNPVSDKRRADNRKRAVIVNGLREAQQGRCARCGAAGVQLDGHERQGGSRRHRFILAPDCALCRRCNGLCEDRPALAAWEGWKVVAGLPHDPALNIGEAWDVNGNRVVFADLAESAS